MNAVPSITASADWREVLAQPSERAHTVQLYTDLGFLYDAVSHYAAAGLRQGEAVILVATADHCAAFTRRLAAGGFDPERLARDGQLTLLDAAETLARFMVNGLPDRARFLPLVGGVLDRVRVDGGYRRIRAYGEMVNLLWKQGQLPAALALEDLWNELAATRPFSLHCAYAMDPFHRAALCGPLGCLQHAHSHLVPVEDYARLDQAVDKALSDVLGPTQAKVLKPVLVDRQRSGAQMPGAQAALFGLAELLPTAADAVLSRARRYYSGPAACA